MNREEEIKKEAAIENKNTENAIVDEDNLGLIDIDDILAEDNAVTRKIKNLFDYGVTEEQIKTLFNSISDISSGASLDEALETLNQIFIVLASKITNSPDVPLVIDLATGEKDEVLTEIQAVELGISYDYITGTTIEIKNEAMMKIVSSLNLEEDFNIKPQVSIYSQITKGLSLESDLEVAQADMDFFRKSFEMDFLSPISNFDFKNLEGADKNVEENIELDMPSMIMDSYISEEADTYFIEYLYKYMRHNPDVPETVEYSQRKLLEALENKNGSAIESKYYQRILDDEGKVDFEKIPGFLANWQHKKNNADLCQQLLEVKKSVFENDVSNIESFSDDSKEDVLLSLAKSLYSSQKDNIKLARELAKKLGITLDKESIIEELNKHTNNSIQSEQDLEEYVSSHEMNGKTFLKKMKKIRKAIEEDKLTGEKKPESAEEIYASQKKHKTKDVMFNSEKAQEIQKILDTVCDNRYDNEKKKLYVLTLYQEFRKQEEENHTKDDIDYLSLTSTIIGKYMVSKKEYFSNFLNDKGTGVDPKRIEEHLRVEHLSSLTKGKMLVMKDMINSRTEKYDKSMEDHAKDLEELRDLIAEAKGKNSEALRKEAFESAKRLPAKAIDEKILRELNALDSKQYFEEFGKDFGKEGERGIKDVPKSLQYMGKVIKVLPKVAIDATRKAASKVSNFATSILNRNKKQKMLEAGVSEAVVNQHEEESEAKAWELDEDERKETNARLSEVVKGEGLKPNQKSGEKGKLEEARV